MNRRSEMDSKKRVREWLITQGVLFEYRRQNPRPRMRWAFYVAVAYSALCVALFTFVGVGR